MAGTAKLGVTLSLVDRATAPLRAFSKNVNSTFEPFRKARNTLKLTAADLGIPKISKILGVSEKSDGRRY
ncbi:MAG: hypothetical protein LUE17_06690 [Planctomycetaceae bacterium]|nr:hypothetical protein [Planctomycetaceae bacterium]